MNKKHTLIIGFSSFLMLLGILEPYAQDPTIRYGTGVPPAVRSINDRSLRYLANTQLEDGSWPWRDRTAQELQGFVSWHLWRVGEGPGLRTLCHKYP